MIATTRAAAAHPALATIDRDYADVQMFAIEEPPAIDSSRAGPWQLLRKEYVYWRLLKEATSAVRGRMPIDSIVLPYADYCFYALAILGSPFRELPWCAISMRLGVMHVAAGPRPSMPGKWRIASRLLSRRGLRVLFSINPSIEDVPASWCDARLRARLRYLADPAPEALEAPRGASRSSLGIVDGDIAILVFGRLDERKGTDALLACLGSGGDLSSYVVILAGKQSPEVARAVQDPRYDMLRSAKRMIVLDRYLTDAEQATVFSAADVVWVGYRGHIYMSGVLVLAGRAGLPVIGTEEGEIGRLIERNGLGLAVRIDRAAEVAHALGVFLDAGSRVRMGNRGRATFAQHSVERFGDGVLAAFDY